MWLSFWTHSARHVYYSVARYRRILLPLRAMYRLDSFDCNFSLFDSRLFPSHHSPRLIKSENHRIHDRYWWSSQLRYLPLTSVKSLRPVCSMAAAPSSCKFLIAGSYVLFEIPRRFHCLDYSITFTALESTYTALPPVSRRTNKNIPFSFLNTFVSFSAIVFWIFPISTLGLQ